MAIKSQLSQTIKIFSTVFLVALLFSLNAEAANKAPPFSLKGMDGKSLSLDQLKGEVVYLDFWATWCPPCRKSFPWMEKMHNRYKDLGLKIVAVSLDGKRDIIDKYLKENPVSFTILHDPKSKVAEKYKLKGMPSSYLIDRRGNLRMSHTGFREKDKAELEAKFKKLLAE